MSRDGLDPQQLQVVTTTEGPLLVFAGAGSGKTRSIIHRAAYLIQDAGIPPWEILIVTFTNKAARELKMRLSALLGIDVNSYWVGTFHSLCSRILRYEASVEKTLPFNSNFTIFDADDQKSIFRKICKELNVKNKDFPLGKIISIISRTKSSLITPEYFFEYNSPNVYTKTVHKIYLRYQEKLLESNGLDFDDILLYTAKLLSENQEVRSKYQKKFSHIMIDEYQDTNYAQFKIVSLLAGERGNICAVGDDDQAIYSWRGASIKNILNFTSDFKNAKTIRLEKNYRSSQPILDLANKLISFNQGRHPKSLWSDQKDGEEPLLQIYETDADEARTTLTDAKYILENHKALGSIAILYRTNAQSRIFETICLEQGIPYRVYGSLTFFQRKEIKDIIAYLRVITNPDDVESLIRIINFPPRAIGGITVSKVIDYCGARDVSFFCGLTEIRNIPTLSQRQIVALETFARNILRWQKMAKEGDLVSLMEDIYERLDLINLYEQSKEQKDITRAENIREFLSAASEFAEKHRKENDDIPKLNDFLQNISLFTSLDNDTANEEGDGNKEKVNLMTLHIAKGLEFENVFITGLEEKLLPHQMSLNTPEEIEEERRLLYVGMTRAKKRLVLSYAKYRRVYYGHEMTAPSRFISEMFPKLGYNTDKTSVYAGGYKGGTLPKKYLASKSVVTENKKQYKIGQTVRHTEYGEGQVLSVNGKGSDAKLSILFSGGKLKNIIGSYVEVLND